jgi:hypothetical protein
MTACREARESHPSVRSPEPRRPNGRRQASLPPERLSQAPDVNEAN